MNKKFATLGALAGIAVASSAAGHAQAGILPPVQSQEFALSTETSFNFSANTSVNEDKSDQTLTFDLFDPSEGTLIAVKIEATFEGNSSIRATEIFSEGGASTDFVGVTNNVSLTFSSNGEGFLSTGQSNPTLQCDADEIDGACNKTEDDDFSDTIVQMSFDLNEFIGLGTFDVDAVLASSAFPESSGELFGSISSDNAVEGDLTVQFEFIPDPVTVSEPASLAILGLGLGGLGIAKRRKRKE